MVTWISGCWAVVWGTYSVYIRFFGRYRYYRGTYYRNFFSNIILPINMLMLPIGLIVLVGKVTQ